MPAAGECCLQVPRVPDLPDPTLLRPQSCCCAVALQLRKLGNSRKYPTGAVKSHGYNSWLQSALNVQATQFPTTKDSAARLYPESYTDSCRFFHRRNWISRPPYSVTTYPHEYFVNQQDGLPVAYRRCAGYCHLVAISLR